MNYEPHQLALIFPNMTTEEYNKLKDDIKTNGQQQPITIYQDKILDGIHRARACVELDIEPKTTEYKGDSPTAFVIASNLHRRHLTTSQRAMLGVELLPHITKEQRQKEQEKERIRLEKLAKKTALESTENEETLGNIAENKNKANLPYFETEPKQIQSRDVVADMVGVSARSIQMAKAIKEKAPDYAKEIANGEKTIAGVNKIISAAKSIKEKRQEVETILLKMQTKPQGIKIGKQGSKIVIVIGHSRAELTAKQANKLREVLDV